MRRTGLLVGLLVVTWCAFAQAAFGFGQVTGSPFAEGDGPGSLAFGPGGALLAVGNLLGVSVSVFAVNGTTGALHQVQGSPFATGGGVVHDEVQEVAFSPGGALLAVANFGGKGSVSVFSVDGTTGALSQVPGSPFATPYPSGVAFSPSGGLLAVTNDFDVVTGVSVFSVNHTTGALSQVPGSPFAMAPSGGVAFSPSGGLLAVGNPASNSVSMFAVNSTTGALSQVPGSPFASGTGASGVAFSPGGGLLAVLNPESTSVSVFAVDSATGALSQVPGSPFANGNVPNSVAFSPGGGLLALTNFFSNSVSVFAVNGATGALSELPGSPFPTGNNPVAAAFSSGGRLLAVSNWNGGNNGNGSLSVFSTAVATPLDPPSVSIETPVDGAHYTRVQVVDASYGCRDGLAGPGVAAGPGISSCGGTVPSGSPIETTKLGPQTFTVAATSRDGQHTSRTVRYTVVLPFSRSALSHVKTYADGTIAFDVNVPGNGRLDVLETAWDDNLARVATLLQPARHRFVFARAHTTLRGAGTIRVSVAPNTRGRLLVARHTYRIVLRLWVTYTSAGGRARSIGVYGLHLGRVS